MRTVPRCVCALAFLLVLAPFAVAKSTTVEGTGDIERMSVNNGDRAVTVKLRGFAAPCEAHYFKIVVFWGKKRAYQADAGCYPGGTWATSLYYLPNRDKGESGVPVGCKRFKIAYKEDRGIYRAFMPRKCLGKAPDRIRVRASGDNYGSTTGGSAGPTKALARG
jgi:hypothetical protein